MTELGSDGILKTCQLGYDGKAVRLSEMMTSRLGLPR